MRRAVLGACAVSVLLYFLNLRSRWKAAMQQQLLIGIVPSSASPTAAALALGFFTHVLGRLTGSLDRLYYLQRLFAGSARPLLYSSGWGDVASLDAALQQMLASLRSGTSMLKAPLDIQWSTRGVAYVLNRDVWACGERLSVVLSRLLELKL